MAMTNSNCSPVISPSSALLRSSLRRRPGPRRRSRPVEARRSILRRPGKVVVQVLDPIPPGLDKDAFFQRLQDAIEPATARLIMRREDRSGVVVAEFNDASGKPVAGGDVAPQEMHELQGLAAVLVATSMASAVSCKVSSW